MKQTPWRKWVVGATVAAQASVLTAALAQNLNEGRTAQDRPFIAGGIGLEESEPLKSMAHGFSLTVVIAATTGAYLADTHVRVLDARGQSVLDTQLYGPYLLVQLAPGRYDVEATHRGMLQQRRLNIDSNSRARVVFTYDVPVDHVSQLPGVEPMVPQR
ncbi:MAG TPA: carboxypeptidase-like regulatory domain-containing protein [Burkholderiaceae bacterium]|nr:carboxypeptidase-like regulatory domain-containing protein [Burkholderiaceae bacterium]